jgi:hypothetical protein
MNEFEALLISYIPRVLPSGHVQSEGEFIALAE